MNFLKLFCRLSAVFGGLFILRKHPKEIIIEDSCVKGILDHTGKKLSTQFLITSPDYVPSHMNPESKKLVSRCICITNSSLIKDKQNILVVIPPNALKNTYSVRILQFSSEMFVCPKGKYLVHLTTQGSKTAREDLETIIFSLFNVSNTENFNMNDGRPAVFYRAYFNYWQRFPKETNQISNLYICQDPNTDLDCEVNLKEARDIFSKICPGEEFLPKAPNPEDIIWVIKILQFLLIHLLN